MRRMMLETSKTPPNSSAIEPVDKRQEKKMRNLSGRQMFWSVFALVILLGCGFASGDWGPIVQLSQTDSASYAGEFGPPPGRQQSVCARDLE